MYVLYMDDSGSSTDKSQTFFVLGGVAVFERQVHWLGRELDDVAAKYHPGNPRSSELHGSPMLSGKNEWKGIPPSKRIEALKDGLSVLAHSRPSTVALCVAVKKSSIPGHDPVEWAFEELCKQFDFFLKSMFLDQRKISSNPNHPTRDAQRGIMVCDESTKETSLQRLAIEFRTTGHKSGGLLRNLVEVPLFVNSRATRLIQLADLIAYATFRYVERQDDRFINVFRHRFHSKSGVEHGLLIKR